MVDIYVSWYDDYGNSYNSAVYFVDSTGDRFLVIDENKNFHWVSIDVCKLLKATKYWND